jgi:hypothetical protein
MVSTRRNPIHPADHNRIRNTPPNLSTTKMNDHTQRLLSTLEALFTTQVKMAEAHGLDTLPHVRLDRAKELLTDIRISKASTKHCK